MRKGLTLVELVVILGIVLVIPLVFIIKFSVLGKGEHSGYITAIDQDGYIFKNYTVYFKTDNSSSQEDAYCIRREQTKLIEKAKEVNRKRKLVLIHYQGVRGIGLGQCHETEIKSIE